MRRTAQARAARALADTVDVFVASGYRRAGFGTLEARLEGGAIPLQASLRPRGRVFGGAYGLELATADAVLPATRGLRGRGRGVVRLSGVSFRARPGDAAGRRVAAQLEADGALAAALRDVHFEEIRIDPDGRPVIRHMGGSVVWLLFPPFVRATPLVPEQAKASAEALAAFARAGRGL